jgi:hypothetical protein
MIDEWRLHEPDLADDLRPHVQGGKGVLPIGESDSGPGGVHGDRKQQSVNSNQPEKEREPGRR